MIFIVIAFFVALGLAFGSDEPHDQQLQEDWDLVGWYERELDK